MNKKLFLSAVSDEFRSYRELLTSDLERARAEVATQEKWGTLGLTTLEKLDQYLKDCGAIIHLVGDCAGHIPPAAAVDALLDRHPDFLPKLAEHTDLTREILAECSYTQIEAYIAIYFACRLHIYRPAPTAPREPDFKTDDRQRESQRLHFERIRKLGRDRDVFLNQERFSSFVLADLSDILLAPEQRILVHTTKLRHSASKLIGREKELAMLDTAWENKNTHVVVIRGKGGEGKTSLVATWRAEMAAKDWRGAETVFDWSFYSQGTKDQSSATSTFFLTAALEHFGDADPGNGHDEDRAARLARLIGERRGVLVLDGLEPLQ